MSLSALIYEMKANHLCLQGRVLEEFNKRGARKAPEHREGTQFVPDHPWWKPVLAGQACRELGGCVRHPVHPSVPPLFSGSSGSRPGTLPTHSSLEHQ